MCLAKLQAAGRDDVMEHISNEHEHAHHHNSHEAISLADAPSYFLFDGGAEEEEEKGIKFPCGISPRYPAPEHLQGKRCSFEHDEDMQRRRRVATGLE